jgi:Lipocalin-like domain
LAVSALLLPTHVPDSAQAFPLKQEIVGTWALVSIYEEDAGGEDVESFGNEPEGYLTLDSSGHFSLEILGAPLKFASNERMNGTSSEYKYAMQQSLAYFGTYSVEGCDGDGSLKLHVRRSSFPNWNNAELQTSVTTQATSMEFTSAALPSPTGAFYGHLVWKRID